MRFQPAKDQAMCLSLRSDKKRKATVTNEKTGSVKKFRSEKTAEGGYILSVEGFKTKHVATYLIRISGKKQADSLSGW